MAKKRKNSKIYEFIEKKTLNTVVNLETRKHQRKTAAKSQSVQDEKNDYVNLSHLIKDRSKKQNK